MRIRLIAFATAAQEVGAATSELELVEGASVGALRQLLVERHAGLAARMPTLAIAVDGELAGDAQPLVDGAEVALLPPVSGG